MQTTQVTKSSGTKAVHIVDTEGFSKHDVFQHALRSTGETAHSIFGYDVRVVDDFSGPVARKVTIVSLHID